MVKTQRGECESKTMRKYQNLADRPVYVKTRVPVEIADYLSVRTKDPGSKHRTMRELAKSMLEDFLVLEPWRASGKGMFVEPKASTAMGRNDVREKRYVQLGLYVPHENRDAAEQEANKLGLSLSSFLLTGVVWWIAREEKLRPCVPRILLVINRYGLSSACFDGVTERVDRSISNAHAPSIEQQIDGDVVLVGLNASVDPRRFGFAIGSYKGGQSTTIDYADLLGSYDGIGKITNEIRFAPRCLVCIDAPLGWPEPMGKVLGTHVAGQLIHVQADDMFRRLTDKYVKAQTGKNPWDVGADRIGRTAVQALNVLAALSQAVGKPVRLAWTPVDLDPRYINVIEVYPAATLHVMELPSSGYKNKRGGIGRYQRRMMDKEDIELRKRREIIVDAVYGHLNGIHRLIDQKADLFDAALCLLAAEDFLAGRSRAPEAMELPIAMKEGWIWVRDRV